MAFVETGMIVHVIVLDKFLPSFIDFVSKHFDITKHRFIFIGKPEYKYGLTINHPVEWIDKKTKVFRLLRYMYEAKKIILHGLWVERINQLLFIQPWLLKKCYWVMWGGDFYFPEQQSWIKKKVIKKMGHFITYVKGDYELTQKWYRAKGEYHECFMYPSNLYKEYDVKSKKHTTLNILVGNSATDTNNHREIFNKLEKYKNENIQIFAPLSYGDENYAKEVIAYGKRLFGDKFVPLTDFMAFEKYIEFLSSIDIAIFAHNRQQAMGTIITLLGMGKKVYMRKDTTPWELFEKIGVKVFDVENIRLETIDKNLGSKNRKRIEEYFSEANYLKQLKKLFEEE
ncbi:TDP-N-acetylfucosamine:lipid II N-acetylfucosaminyltransferase [Thermospira aquatica]|uniref:TDP-N-acetylfucosamine:lipid II N-acetylfucosaminyltransferase n=1 Tax=Thermospira aquatica TaxID=2828656 RepID=A0AAX3BES0_9SPIR|nr:TDP-N-acetylfucosamine:lipid II N-acetylfucosaminyltransferase [Thermospira aquatica]URA10844.1 TDP-N-acetylfucosamine:lipid II N-acetylfucosaminyltransferase [Thermospira aquatica]